VDDVEIEAHRGVISPTSMLTVMITPNQTGSKSAAMRIGSRIGAVIRMIAAGGRKHPAISKRTLIAAIRTQGLTSRLPTHSARLWVR
jgi:hypothetical protein